MVWEYILIKVSGDVFSFHHMGLRVEHRSVDLAASSFALLTILQDPFTISYSLNLTQMKIPSRSLIKRLLPVMQWYSAYLL